MKIMLLCSAFNGLSQRFWIRLRALGHDVAVHLASDATPIDVAARSIDPELIICPFLKDRVPEAVWRRYRTIIIHPGPTGDRGPSSLDWAIAEGHPKWGVTALQAVEEMDAGPIWATRTFGLATEPVRKGSLYNGAVADAAVDMIDEIATKARDPHFVPVPLDYRRSDVWGRLRPTMKQANRAFSWEQTTDEILRRIRAADGAPGVRTILGGRNVSVFDAHRGPDERLRPGTIIGARHGSVLVTTGDGSLWVGQAKPVPTETERSIKLPAAALLRDRLVDVPTTLGDPAVPVHGRRDDVTYERRGDVGVVSFDFYNGAMSTPQCRRLTAALRRATEQDTKVLLLRGGETFSNGIHLNVIEAADNPVAEAWANINAIDDLCRTIITCTDQLVVSSIGANAGAGGVMLALGADRVYLRQSVVLNPHYATMGLYGSEYWTYSLPRRVGPANAEVLTQDCLPVGAAHAARIGLVDDVLDGDRDEFEDEVLSRTLDLAGSSVLGALIRAKRRQRERDEDRKPLEAYRVEELGQMSRDMFDNRSGFAQARRRFVFKQRPMSTPPHLVAA
ncbi:MAG: enoyl-CoA hydratase-related protein [Acidimicrobiia bacterium]|nr:enoyl-CoA hydratase-related protein [Acidimicrobiia bacterium]